MTIQFHAKLYALRRSPKGFIVQLEVDATDQWQEVASADLGTQFGVAMVPVERETGQPIMKQPAPEPRPAGTNAGNTPDEVGKSGIHPLVQKAGILAKSVDFQKWVDEQEPANPPTEISDVDFAVAYIRSECGIQSRKELATNPEAAAKFEKLVQRYYEAQR